VMSNNGNKTKVEIINRKSKGYIKGEKN